MIFLRQSTASQEIPLGRFVDSTDGNTEKTALTIANTDIKIWKTGATTLANKTSGGATHIANGEYYCVLDATDTDTIGPMKVTIHVAGALYVQVFCTVLDEAVYDVLFGTTALATISNITAGTITTATNVTSVNGIGGHTFVTGTSDAGGSTTTMVDAARTEADTDYWKGAYILFTSGTVAGQSRRITGFNTTTDTITFSPATTQSIGAGITYAILPVVNTADSADVADIAAGVRTELAPELATVSSIPTLLSAMPGDVWAYVVEGTHTAVEYFRLMASALFAKASGLGTTTAVFRDVDDTKDRITATVDSSGNRTAVTLDES